MQVSAKHKSRVTHCGREGADSKVLGITKYAAAQETEKDLAANLVGTYVVDKSAIDSLKMDIMQGIQLNENNLKLVSITFTAAALTYTDINAGYF